MGDGLDGEGAGFLDCGRGRDDVEAVDFAWGDIVSLGGLLMQRKLRLLLEQQDVTPAACREKERVTYS